MKPRRQQTPITIRSDRAAARLALLTRTGRSQAEVIEEALERLPAEPELTDAKARRERIDELSRRFAAGRPRFRSMKEFDEATYDERGLLR
jgi:antitoxin VapB